MIYLCQNDRQYDYDIRAITLAFLPGEKIVEVTDENEADEGNIFLKLHFGDDTITGQMKEQGKIKAQEAVVCDYNNHEHCRNDVCRFLYRLLSSFTGKDLPWGVLTGIRPTKIIMKWMEEENPADLAALAFRFAKTYLTTEQKAQLCTEVARHEKELLGKYPYSEEYSLYVGIPFCPTTCLYCSFTSFPVLRFGDRMEPYLKALYKELSYVAKTCADRKLTSVYIGGGTPTALDEKSLESLLQTIRTLFPMEQVKEFTVEAGRPDSVTREKFHILKNAGVTRISINPQTMNQETLDLIGRAHTVEQTKDAFMLARACGFDNINMDIITGLPGEDISHVRHTLKKVFELRPESLTVHSLAIKRAANLNIEMERYRNLVKGSTDEMLCLVDEYCHRMGLMPYYMYRQKNIPGNLENIGYSLPGKECLYNILIMEEKQDIISCGAGATSKYVFPKENRIERTENVKNLDHYINRIDEMIDRKRRYHEG